MTNNESYDDQNQGPAVDYTEGGGQIYRHEGDVQPPEPAGRDSDLMTQVVTHVSRYAGAPGNVWHELASDVVPVDVHHIPPNDTNNFHTLFTTGMSSLPMNVPQGLEDERFAELMLALPPDWPISEAAFYDINNYWPIQMLRQLARMPHQTQSWLGLLHSMNNGEPPAPFAPNTAFTGVIVLRPVLFGEGIRTLRLPDRRVINLLALIPLYQDEMTFKLQNGGQALAEQLNESGVTELIDVERERVV